MNKDDVIVKIRINTKAKNYVFSEEMTFKDATTELSNIATIIANGNVVVLTDSNNNTIAVVDSDCIDSINLYYVPDDEDD